MILTQVITKSYKHILKPVLFRFDPEFIHNRFLKTGKLLGKFSLTRNIMSELMRYDSPVLSQELFGRTFKNPIGLAAGFDYNGNLTQILDSVGFGFQSVGTVTFNSYDGNPKPRLARLPKSKSLLVNKGFKSEGITKVLNKNLSTWNEEYQVGLSIGATNSKDTSTPDKQIEDILKSFKYVRNHKIFKRLAYLELNISCPNVQGSGSLTSPQSLSKVLRGIRALKINKPLLVKFQLEIEWEEARKLIQIMIDNKVEGIIIANLLKKRDENRFDKGELEKVKNLKGNFSGKPTFALSNELIEKTYTEFGDKIKIIGCGGVFSAEDAYEKLKRGASLVQMVTGMIYEGPQIIGKINSDLEHLLKQDGYSSIKDIKRIS